MIPSSPIVAALPSRTRKVHLYMPPWTGIKNVAPMALRHGPDCSPACHCRVIEWEAVRLGHADWIIGDPRR